MNPLASGFGLTGRAALVTGASSGLGRHFALTLAAAGATVVVAARRVDKLAAAVADIEAAIEAASDRPDTPGELVRQWFKNLYQGNKLTRNQPVLGGCTVDLRKVTVPVLNVSADGDVVIPAACSRGQGRHFGATDCAELSVPGGRIGARVGGKAQAVLVVLAPGTADWLEARNPLTKKCQR